MKTLIGRFMEISWRRGNGACYACLIISLLAAIMLVLHMECSNIMYASAVASTRSDMIADSAALYAQSYDYKYNKAQAETMATLLTAYNNGTSGRYELASSISFPDDDLLTVKCDVQTFFYFPGLAGHETLTVSDEASVRSVDIWGDIFVVPDSVGHASSPGTTPPVGDLSVP